MTAPVVQNTGAFLKTACSNAGNTATAAGTGDNTEVAGAIIDLTAIGNPRSAKLVISYVTTLTADKTLSFAVDVDHGDASNLSDASVLDSGFATTVVKTGAVTAGVGTVELDVNLAGAKRYVRANATPDMSHTSADTAAWSMTWVFSGFPNDPSTASL